MMQLFPAIRSRTTGKISVRKPLAATGGLTLLAAAILLYPNPPRIAGIRSPVTVRPNESLAAAITAAKPGTTIVVKAGTYREKLTTARSGTAALPITIRAEGKVILEGKG